MKMQKPISMVIDEFEKNLANCINQAMNQSGLHVSIVKSILGNFYNEVCSASEQVTKNDIAMYNQKIKEEEKKSETEKSKE